MRNHLEKAAFYGLNALLLPVTLTGYAIWVGKGIVAKRGSGVSGTAQGPLSGRYFQHEMGTREDEAASRLMRALPDVPPLGLYLSSAPLFFAHRMTGYVPSAFRYPFTGDIPPHAEAAARVTFFDAAVERYLPEIAQFVILGAGFDTRAFRLPAGAKVRTFEVDTPKTQAVKREVLTKAGIDSSGVTFVPADFEKEDWLTKLIEAGFDLNKPAFFLWEGVIIYLDKEAVEATLRKIAGTAKGSVIAFDYFTTEAIDSKSLYWRYARAATKAAGEPLKFGIDSRPPSRERLAELLQSCGLALIEQRTLGDEREGKRAWGGFAIASAK